MLIKSLLIMIFLGIVDEFYFQGKLENLKNKYGLGYGESEKNKDDWKTALLIHSFSWTFMIHFPILYQILGRIPPLLREAKVGDECQMFY